MCLKQKPFLQLWFTLFSVSSLHHWSGKHITTFLMALFPFIIEIQHADFGLLATVLSPLSSYFRSVIPLLGLYQKERILYGKGYVYALA